MGTRTAHYWDNPYLSGAPRNERRSGEYATYTPSHLAAVRLHLSPATDQAVARAERAVRQLHRSAHHDLALIARFLLRSEAIASSYIEGIAPSPRNVALAELGRDEEVTGISRSAQEVARNMTLVQDASEKLVALEKVGVSDIVRLQESLIDEADLRGLRQGQNWIGGSAYHPLEAAHIPPPAEQLPELLADLVDYLSGAAHSAIVQAALVHAQFETIHPFPDGNGRVGRALIHTVLSRRGLTEQAILPVSLVLATQQHSYISGLDAFRFEGDPNSPEGTTAIETWVKVFADAVTTAAEQASQLQHQLEQMRSEWRILIDEARQQEGRERAVRKDSALHKILDRLPGTPVLTTSTVTRIHGVTATAAQRALEQLHEYGILETLSIGKSRRAYVSLDVLELISRSERAMASRDFDTAISPPVRPVPALPQGN